MDDRRLTRPKSESEVYCEKVAPMVEMSFEMPEGVFAALRKDPAAFAKELRLAAAVKWYETRQVSQERAAEIAGLSRAEFIEALGRCDTDKIHALIENKLFNFLGQLLHLLPPDCSGFKFELHRDKR